MEDLPYLEVLCVSDPVNVSAAEDDEEEIPQICDKQVSLIAVAWSKPPADDTEREGEGSVNAHTQTCDIRAAEHTLCAGTAGGSEAAEIPSGSTGHPDTDLQPGTTEVRHTADIKHVTVASCHLRHSPSQLTSGEKVTADQPATLQWDHSSPANNRTGETGGEDVEVPPCPTASHSELLDASEGQRRTSRPTVSPLLLCADVCIKRILQRLFSAFTVRNCSVSFTEGILSAGERARRRTCVSNGEREDHAQPGGHAEKGGAEAAERQRDAAAEGERAEPPDRGQQRDTCH